MESLTLLHNRLTQKQCLCHLATDHIVKQLGLPRSEVISLDEGNKVLMPCHRDELLLRLSLIAGVAELDHCHKVGEIKSVLFKEDWLEQVWSLTGCMDQLIAFSSCKLVKMVLCNLAHENRNMVAGFLSRALHSILRQQPSNNRPPTHSHHDADFNTNRVMFTFDLFTNLLRSSPNIPRSEVKSTAISRLPCMTSAEIDASSDKPCDRESDADIAAICREILQGDILELCTVMLVVNPCQTSKASTDSAGVKAFHEWLQTLQTCDSQRVCMSFFRLLHAYIKLLTSDMKHKDSSSVLHSLITQIFAAVKARSASIAILKMMLDVMITCIDTCKKDVSARGDIATTVGNLHTNLGAAIQSVVRATALTSWVDDVPYHNGPMGFGGTNFQISEMGRLKGCARGDTVLLRKLARLVVSCMEYAATVPDVAGVDGGDRIKDATLQTQCLRNLSTVMLARLNHVTPTVTQNICNVEWIFYLFGDQDDALVSVMFSLLKIQVACKRQTESEVSNFSGMEDGHQLKSILNPHLIFTLFLGHVTWDHSILLDLLISMETEFLEYFVSYLHLVTFDWPSFIHFHQSHKQDDCHDIVNTDQRFQKHVTEYPTCTAYLDDDDDDGGDDDDSDDGGGDELSSDDEQEQDYCQTKDILQGTKQEKEKTTILYSKCAISNSSKRGASDSSSHQTNCDDVMHSEERKKQKLNDDFVATQINEGDCRHQFDQQQTGVAIQKSNEFSPNTKRSNSVLDDTTTERSSGHYDPNSQACVDGDMSSSSLDETMTVLIRLRLAIERLDDKGLFPYSANPLKKLLLKAEELYEFE